MMTLEDRKGILVDTDQCVKKQQLPECVPFQIQSMSSMEEAQQAVCTGQIDFVIMHEPPDTTGINLVRQLRQEAPAVPTILLCEAASGTWAQEIAEPALELVFTAAPASELLYRIAALLQKFADLKEEEEEEEEERPRVYIEPVPSLRSPKSGRLDAQLIADAFGIKLVDIAKAVGKPYTTVHKTPDSEALQLELLPFERIASAVNSITGGKLEQGLKIWLNAPNKAFPDHLPVNLIKEGRAGMLADLLEDVLLGHPD